MAGHGDPGNHGEYQTRIRLSAFIPLIWHYNGWSEFSAKNFIPSESQWKQRTWIFVNQSVKAEKNGTKPLTTFIYSTESSGNSIHFRACQDSMPLSANCTPFAPSRSVHGNGSSATT